MVVDVREPGAWFREVTWRRLREQQGLQVRGIYETILLEEGPGNPRDRHYYTASAIQSGPTIFEGLPCFADHPDEIEDEVRPERSVKDIVGYYRNVRAEQDQASGKWLLVADLVTVAGGPYDWFRNLLNSALEKQAQDPQAPPLIGLSINAAGITETIDVAGEEWQAVQEFVDAKSVDCVTQAGAGGKVVALLESMKKRVREGQMTALQVKRASDALKTKHDPDLKPIVDVLDKAYLDLTHAPDKGGEAMRTTQRERQGEAEDERQRQRQRQHQTEDERQRQRQATRAAESEDEDESRESEDEDESREREGGGERADERQRQKQRQAQGETRQKQRQTRQARASETEDEDESRESEDEDESREAREDAISKGRLPGVQQRQARQRQKQRQGEREVSYSGSTGMTQAERESEDEDESREFENWAGRQNEDEMYASEDVGLGDDTVSQMLDVAGVDTVDDLIDALSAWQSGGDGEAMMAEDEDEDEHEGRREREGAGASSVGAASNGAAAKRQQPGDDGQDGTAGATDQDNEDDGGDDAPYGHVHVPVKGGDKVTVSSERKQREDLPPSQLKQRQRQKQRQHEAMHAGKRFANRVPTGLREAVASRFEREAVAAVRPRTLRERKLLGIISQLRAEKAVTREELQVNRTLESMRVPQDAWPFLKPQLRGLSSKAEQRAVIEAFRASVTASMRDRPRQGPSRLEFEDDDRVIDITSRLADHGVPMREEA